MKKNLWLLVAILATTLVGCNPDQKTGQNITVTSIAVRPTELLLAAGRQERIYVSCQPEGAQVPTITWTSSNPDVATVEAGVITAIGSGNATITASTPDGLTASCSVTVDSPFKVFALSGYGVGFGALNEIEGTDTSVELTDGSTVSVRLATTGLIAWTDGVSYAKTSEGGQITGAGEVLYADVYVYIITDGDYKGYRVSSSGGYFVGSGEPEFGMIKAGGITSAEDYALGVMNMLSEDGDQAVYENAFIDGGATIMHFEDNFYVPYFAYVTEGVIGGTERVNGEVLYANLKATWFVGTPYDVDEETSDEEIDAIWGLKLDEEGYLVDPIELVTATEIYSNATLEEGETPAEVSARFGSKDKYILVEPGKIDVHQMEKKVNKSLFHFYKK